MKSDAKPASVKKGRAPEDDRSAAQRVLRIEGEGLEALSAALNEDDSLTKAADLLESLEGRLVVTGMGKSGHIARKIAATLASTGTPALYVHPGEASHGDLGMVGREDAVLALSNSGNTAELADIIGYTRRFSIPLIAMTARGDSQLAEQADIRLLLPRAPEACPMGLAPTTSTTLMLALGDALAVVLLERKGFSASDFAVFHPGGSLGGQLLRVQDVMHGGGELPLSPPDALMSEAIVRMTAAGFGCIGIADPEGALLGIITDGDLRRHMGEDLLQRTAGEVMTRSPKTIRPEALAAEALGFMNENLISSLFVTEGDRPVGIIRLHDCLRAGVA
ncbi:MAG: KpsF/GutQ family sugar-phosphate isomerase [Limibacillus sp.]|jgi:arabinose-5-phosphate isomerase